MPGAWMSATHQAPCGARVRTGFVQDVIGPQSSVRILDPLVNPRPNQGFRSLVATCFSTFMDPLLSLSWLLPTAGRWPQHLRHSIRLRPPVVTLESGEVGIGGLDVSFRRRQIVHGVPPFALVPLDHCLARLELADASCRIDSQWAALTSSSCRRRSASLVSQSLWR